MISLECSDIYICIWTKGKTLKILTENMLILYVCTCECGWTKIKNYKKKVIFPIIYIVYTHVR